MESPAAAAAAAAAVNVATTPAVAIPTKSAANGRRKKGKPKITAAATVVSLWLKRFAFKFLFFIVISFILSSQVRLLLMSTTLTSSSSSTPDQDEGIPTAATTTMEINNNTNQVQKDETGSRTEFESPVTAKERSRKTLDLRWKDGCMYIPDRKSQSHLRQNDDAAVPATPSSSTTTTTTTTTGRGQQPQQQDELPTGIVVTVVIAPKNRQHMMTGRRQICDNLPNQWMYFLHPQQIDMILLINPSGGGWNVQYFVECLNLQHHHDNAVRQNTDTASSQPPPLQQTWTNLDGSQLETTQYMYQGPAGTSSNGKTTHTQLPPPIRIYVASTVVKYPLYIQKNPSLLDLRKYGPKGCSGRLTYLNGCRYYTQEMLHLQILQPTSSSLSTATTPSQQPQQQIQRHDGYDYFIKMDTDIVFRKSPTFFLLQDMINQGAVFAHAGEYHPWGDSSCAPGILDAISNYTEHMKSTNPNNDVVSDTINRKVPNWNRRMCSFDAPEMNRDADQYYGNFIIGSVQYFTSPAVRSFANFLSNYPSGFFRHKWGDQIFWHYAMGIFLGTTGRTRTRTTTSTMTSNKTNGDSHDFTRYVLDYTDLRCKPNPNCWFSANYVDVFGPNASITCSS